jgi:hypothetical protein
MTNGYFIDWKKFDINTDGRGTEVHPLLAMLLVPMVGLAFLMFLPFIGFYLCAQAGIAKLTQVIKSIADNATAPIATAGTAHLTGNEPSGNTEETSSLEELSKEIQARRR